MLKLKALARFTGIEIKVRILDWWKSRRQIWRRTFAIAAPVLLVVGFQNCTKLSFNSTSPNSVANTTSSSVTPPSDSAAGALTQSAPVGPFKWQIASDFAACDHICGQGLSLRTVQCLDEGSGLPVVDSYCDAGARPISQQACSVANTSCQVWINNSSDLMNLSTTPFAYACLNQDVDLRGQSIDSRFLANLSNQTFNGCGHAISRFELGNRGFFHSVQNSNVIHLHLNDYSVSNVQSVDLTGAIFAGVFSDIIGGSSHIENVQVNSSNNIQLQMTGFATFCGAFVGEINGGSFSNIKMQNASVQLQCYFAGGFAGRIFPVDSAVSLQNIDVNISSLYYGGSGYASGATFIDGLIGGFVGRYFALDNSVPDSFSNISVTSAVTVGSASVGAVGGVAGQLFNVGKTVPLFTGLNFMGSITTTNAYCSLISEHSGFTAIGGVVGSYFPALSGSSTVLASSGFSGHIQMNECKPDAYAPPRTPQGQSVWAGRGLGRNTGQGGVLQLQNFTGVGGLTLQSPEQTFNFQLDQGAYVWRLSAVP